MALCIQCCHRHVTGWKKRFTTSAVWILMLGQLSSPQSLEEISKTWVEMSLFYDLKSCHYGVEMDTYRCHSSVERFLGNTATDRLGLALLSYLHLKLTSESIGATESLALLYNMFLVAVIHLLWFACLKHIFVSLSLSFPLCVSDILMLFDFLVLDKHTWQIN